MTVMLDQNPNEHALSYPEFRWYYVGAVLGTNGGWIVRILLSWLAWDLTGSPSFVGVIATASLLPVAVFGPIFGALADRMSIKTAYVRVGRSLLVVPVCLFSLLALNALTPAVLFAVAFLFGTFMSAYHPVRQSIGPRLVERSAIGSTVALSALNFNIGRLLAPALGGILIARYGAMPTSILAILLAIPTVLIAPRLMPREEEKSTESTTLLNDLKRGFRVVWERWEIRRAILLAITALAFIRGMSEILAIVADGEFARGAQGLGLMTSALGFGALFAAGGQVYFGSRLFRNMKFRIGAIIAGYIGVAGMVFAPSFDVALGFTPFVGFASTFVGVSLQVGVQARLEDELRGRVMSIWMLSNTLFTAVVAMFISALSEWIALPLAVSIVMSICGGLAAVVLLSWGQKDA